MVNELLIQMQSFDQPRGTSDPRAAVEWLNGYMPDRPALKSAR
jgi:hypothetical protein